MFIIWAFTGQVEIHSIPDLSVIQISTFFKLFSDGNETVEDTGVFLLRNVYLNGFKLMTNSLLSSESKIEIFGKYRLYL